MKIDKTDKDILNVLLENSRLSYRQIAKKIGKSVATVMHRVKALEKEGIINTYTVDLDYEKLGYDLPVLIEITVGAQQRDEAGSVIGTNGNISGVYDISGDFDEAIFAIFKNRKQLDNYIKELGKHKFILKTNTHLILRTIKETPIKIR